jgi:hypothetical protein
VALKIVGEQEMDAPPGEALAPTLHVAQQRLAAQLLGVAFKALSEKAVIAVASLFSLLLAASVFWLALSVSQAPSNLQLVELGMYGAFVLGLHVVKRR